MSLKYEPSSSGPAAMVEKLLAAGADKEAKSVKGLSPLHVAAGIGHVAVVETLLAAGADKEATDEGGLTPLHFAAASGQRESFLSTTYWSESTQSSR